MDSVDLLKNEGVFVIHALKGYKEHEIRIQKLFYQNEINFEFVTEGDTSFLNSEIINKYFVSNIKDYISEGVLSCTLNHILAYEKIAKRKLKYAIIFENDVFFLKNSFYELKKCESEIQNLPSGFIISLENSTLRFPSFWQIKRNKYLYKAKSGRMAGAYLIDLEGVNKILENLKIFKCQNVIDWWHNSLIEKGVIDLYWMHPAIVEQGSHNGFLNSTISSKPKSLSRRLSWQFQKIYKYYFRRIFNNNKLFFFI